jgi:hypothetical protein
MTSRLAAPYSSGAQRARRTLSALRSGAHHFPRRSLPRPDGRVSSGCVGGIRAACTCPVAGSAGGQPGTNTRKIYLCAWFTGFSSAMVYRIEPLRQARSWPHSASAKPARQIGGKRPRQPPSEVVQSGLKTRPKKALREIGSRFSVESIPVLDGKYFPRARKQLNLIRAF